MENALPLKQMEKFLENVNTLFRKFDISGESSRLDLISGLVGLVVLDFINKYKHTTFSQFHEVCSKFSQFHEACSKIYEDFKNSESKIFDELCYMIYEEVMKYFDLKKKKYR